MQTLFARYVNVSIPHFIFILLYRIDINLQKVNPFSEVVKLLTVPYSVVATFCSDYPYSFWPYALQP